MLYTIIIGFIVGLVAKFFMPGKEGGGFIMTTLLGIGGSIVGGWISGMLGMGSSVGFIGSVLGAMLLLWLFSKFGSK